MKLGDKILELRKKSSLSQEQLGEKINVTRQTISNWELNETNPNPEQLILLASIFNISVDELLGYKLIKKGNNYQKYPKDFALSFLVLIFAGALIFSLILLLKEKDKNTIKLHLTTEPTTTSATSKITIDDTFIRTFEVLELEKVICDGTKTGCDDTTYNITLKQCKKETKKLQISNSLEFKKLEKGKTYEFKFKPLVGEIYYEDNIENIFAFNTVISITETNKKCNNQIQDAIKTRSL